MRMNRLFLKGDTRLIDWIGKEENEKMIDWLDR